MSAICGIIAPDAGTESLRAMLGELAGYGAKSAAWSDAGAALGACGASATHVACAFDDAAGLAAVASARLDDRQALNDALGAPAGCDDAALVLRAWRRWGRDCPNHLLGDFAFAIWDSRRRELFCARDQVGVRPFYYAASGGRFVFGSAVQAVLQAPGVSHELDATRVVEDLSGMPLVESPERTFYAAVSRLPAGHWLAWADGKVRVRRYWRPEGLPSERPASDAAALEELLHWMQRAVSDRLGQGPIGVEVSGGLDSSAVATLAARELKGRGGNAPLAFTTLPSPNPERGPSPQQDALAALCRREGLHILHCPQTADDQLKNLLADHTLPGSGHTAIRRHATARNVRTMLSGFGGDQGGVSHNGLGYFHELLLKGRLRRAWKEIGEHRKQRGRRLAKLSLEVLRPGTLRDIQRLTRRRPPQRHWLIHQGFAKEAASRWPRIPRVLGVRQAQLLMLRGGTVAGELEARAALRASTGTQTLYPLLDRRLLEFAFRLPPDYYLRAGEDRWLFRQALARLLPGMAFVPKDNQSEREGAIQALAGAMPALRRAIETAKPGRTRFVDMAGLLARLDAERFLAHPQPAPIVAALRILKF